MNFIPHADTNTKQKIKAQLRTDLQHRRNVIPADLQSTTQWKAINHIRTLLTDTNAKIIALYSAIEGEIDLTPLAEELWQEDITLCLPRVIQKNHPLVFNIWEKNTPLEPDALGIMAATGTEITPKLMLIPAVGYSKNAYRLGYGGGYYDRTIKALGADTLSAAICHTELEIKDFPAEYHDQTVDYIVTGKELITCR